MKPFKTNSNDIMKTNLLLVLALSAFTASGATILQDNPELLPVPPGWTVENTASVAFELGIPAGETFLPATVGFIPGTIPAETDSLAYLFRNSTEENICECAELVPVVIDGRPSEVCLLTDIASPSIVPEPDKILYGAAGILFLGFRRIRS